MSGDSYDKAKSKLEVLDKADRERKAKPNVFFNFGSFCPFPNYFLELVGSYKYLAWELSFSQKINFFKKIKKKLSQIRNIPGVLSRFLIKIRGKLV